MTFSGRIAALFASTLLAATTAQAQEGKKPLKVGLVFDVGGLGDKSFNDAAHEGMERAKKDFGILGEAREPGDGSQRVDHLRQMASGEPELIIGVGFLFTDDIREMAKEFPDKKFACVDFSMGKDELPPNLAALNFREEEGAYLVGAAAALASKSGQVGFVGGVDSPLIRKFELGYRLGAKAVKPDVKVRSTYAGITDSAFKDPQKGKELATSLYDSGVDVIFHASGSTGLGVFRAAEAKKKLAIGVDRNQEDDAAPGTILTSMIKLTDRAVYEVIRETKEGKFKGGLHALGLKEGAVDYVYNDKNKALFPAGAREKIEAIKADIVAGKTKVPAKE